MSIFQKDEWEPYLGPQGGEGWRNADTDEVVYDEEPPGESEFEFLDESMDPQDISEGERYAVFAEGGNLETVSILDVSDTGVTVQDEDDNEERSVEREELAQRVIAEAVVEDNRGISSGDVITTDYDFDITVDEVQADGVMSEDGYFFSFDDIKDYELDSGESEDGDNDESIDDGGDGESINVNLDDEEVNRIVDDLEEMDGPRLEYNEDVLNELRDYSTENLEGIENAAKKKRTDRDLIIEFLRLNSKDVQEEMVERYTDKEPGELHVPSAAIANSLLEDMDGPDEVVEFLESEYDDKEIPERATETKSSQMVEHIMYQRGDRDVEDILDFSIDANVDVDTTNERVEKVKSATKSSLESIGDKMNDNVEAFALSDLEEVEVNLMGPDGRHTGSRIEVDLFADNKQNVMTHEIGHHVHNAIGIVNSGIDGDSYDNNVAPKEPELGYNTDALGDPLDINTSEKIEDAWQNYADGNARQLRKYQNRNLVEYAAVTFRYAIRNPDQLERRDENMKNFWDDVFSGGKDD